MFGCQLCVENNRSGEVGLAFGTLDGAVDWMRTDKSVGMRCSVGAGKTSGTPLQIPQGSTSVNEEKSPGGPSVLYVWGVVRLKANDA